MRKEKCDSHDVDSPQGREARRANREQPKSDACNAGAHTGILSVGEKRQAYGIPVNHFHTLCDARVLVLSVLA
jgi:hypothetical protein